MPRVAFLFLANHAEVRDGLLNALGGGWNRYILTRQPDGAFTIAHFGIVVGVAFDPGDAANRAHLAFRIESDKGDTILTAESQIEVAVENVPITRLLVAAFNTEVRWQTTGTYHLRAWVDPNQETRFTFAVAEPQSAPT